MEIVPVKNRKTQTKIQIITLIFVLAIPYIMLKVVPTNSIEQIKDTNGTDTAIVTFNIKDYFIDKKDNIINSDSIENSGSSSKKESDIIEEVDCDSIKYSFDEFSGMKILQQTEVSKKTKFIIKSKINKGNCEVAIFKDKVFVKVFNAGENIAITFKDSGIYTIVIGGESASGNVTTDRQH